MTDQTQQQAGGQQTGQSSTSGSSNQSAPGANTGTQEAGSQSTIQNSSQQQSEPAKRPAFLLDTEWDGTAGKIKDEAAVAKRINDLVAFKAAEDSRLLTLPQKAEDFKPVLSKDFKAPQGIEFVPNENDPLLPQARAFALKHHLSQDAFSELMDLHASSQIGLQQSLRDFETKELAKLGAAATARKTAVDTWLVARLGDDLGKHVAATMKTAMQVQAFEKLMSNDRAQGAGSFSQSHREQPQQNGKIEGYENMTFEQRRAAQDQQRRAAAN